MSIRPPHATSRAILAAALAGTALWACSDDAPPYIPPADAGGDAADAMDATDTGGDAPVDAPDDADVPPDIPGDVADTADTPDTTPDTVTDTGPPMAWPNVEGLTVLTLDGSGAATDLGSFEDATPLTDLTWASTADVGCWDNPAVNDEFFSGPYLAYALEAEVDAWTDVTISLTPDENAEANLIVLEQNHDWSWDVRTVPPAVGSAYCHRPETFGGAGATTEYTFRIYKPSTIYFAVSNRNRFPGDDTGNVRVDVQATPVAEGDQCYAAQTDPGRQPPHVEPVRLDREGGALFRGTLEAGAPVCGDGQWLDDAFCVPETHLDRFDGLHRFYAIDGGIPEFSVVTISVIPDPGVDVSLYGSQQGLGTSFRVPPAFPITLCESSLDYRNRNAGESESITFTATTNPYEIFFAVATDDETAAGGYTVVVDLITYSTDTCEEEDWEAVTGLDDWPSSVTTLDGSSGAPLQVRFDLSDGEPLCSLEWAASSQTACFPATENTMFDGNTTFFALDPPPPAGSNVYVTARPGADVDVSVFGYRLGVDNYMVPPNVPVVGQCEASYARGVGDVFNPGAPESIEFLNPGPYQYVYFIGVSGVDGADAGSVTLEVEIEEDPPPHCPESLPGTTYPFWPSTVTQISAAEGSATGSGDLAEGACTNLRFAAQSDVACFPATQFDNFEGNHVLYALNEPMPPHSELEITVTPEDGVDVNVWGTQSGVTSFPVPPRVPSVIACEASYSFSAPNPGEPETIRFSNPTDNPYNIGFAVAGPAGTTAGGFTYDVTLTTGTIHCEESLEDGFEPTVTPISLRGSSNTVDGNLEDGTCVNLDFASRSDVACFPATSFGQFTGNHVFYEVTGGLPPLSSMTVVADPTSGVDVNLYGFQRGTDDTDPPPGITSAICEASYPWRTGNPGEPESIRFFNPSETNSYSIVLAVAGPEGMTAGDFELSVDLDQGELHCEESLPGSSYSDWPGSVQRIDAPVRERTGFSQTFGAIECVNLGWAASSQTACFPATENASYEGEHAYFALEAPLPGGHAVTIEVSESDVSLYGYRTNTASYFVPPYVPTAGACEYVLAGDGSLVITNPGRTPANVFFGAALPSRSLTRSVSGTVTVSPML